jgi:polyhydroxybutyrate depolymerase
LSVPADAAGVPGSAGFDGVSFWNFFGSSDPGTLTDCGGPTLSIPASRPDDVGFIDRLLDTMLDEYCVDSGRVFATGMSNGAGMSTTLGCELATGSRPSRQSRATTSAARAPATTTRCRCLQSMATPTPSQVTAATTCSGSSSATRRCRTAWRPGPPTTAARSGRRSTRSTAGLAVTSWSGCDDGTDVELWTLAGWSHGWPPATAAGQPGVIDATDAVLEFFDDQGRS